ncbi:MAG: hypothetical protein CL843_16405 [Crocinitomicaceae bacterium]|nr:hypothetical protein [Crocinitomicaceae bacterium]|tara:strand:+ start:1116 stop:1439 length:324 start_codon:yes stop_codon:yes gene_type:complete
MSKIVEKVFKSHPNAKKVFTTSDGMPFVNEHNAKLHSKTLKDKTVKTHERPKEESEKVTAKELIDQIEAAKTVAEIDALVPEGEKRSTVLAAVEKAKKELDEGGGDE